MWSNRLRVFTLVALVAILLCPLAASAFPTAPVLDNFNRPDGPLNTGNWLGPVYSSTTFLAISSQQATSASTIPGVSVWNLQTFSTTTTGLEAYVDVPVINGTDRVLLEFLVNTTPSNTTGYELSVNRTGNAWELTRILNGSGTTLATGTQAIHNGDGVGLSILSGTLTFWYRPGPTGTWTNSGTAADSTYTNGFIGAGVDGNVNRLDNFGGGQTVSTAPQVGTATLGPTSVSFPVTWPATVAPYTWTAGTNDGFFGTSGTASTNSVTITFPYDPAGSVTAFFCEQDFNGQPAAPGNCAQFLVPAKPTPTRTATVKFTNLANNDGGFAIQRCAGVGCAFTNDLVTLPTDNIVGDTITYVDTSSPTPTSCYRARALGTGGAADSGYSNTGCFTITVPSAPTNFHFTDLMIVEAVGGGL